MNDIKIQPFFWFRPVTKGKNREVCFRVGVNALPQQLPQQEPRLAMDLPGSPVRPPLMETPSWTPPNGGFFHFGRFEAIVFLARLYTHFVCALADYAWEPNKYNLETLINDNWDLSPLHGRQPKILVGDMTGHGGLAVPGHETHATGQQIDIHYIPVDGTNERCSCGAGPGTKKWHLGLNALLLHCILEAGAWSVVTDCKELLKTARPAPGQRIKPSTRGALVHADHFHVDILYTDPRSRKLVDDLYANAQKGILVAPSVFI